jgi:hypothetical protein
MDIFNDILEKYKFENKIIYFNKIIDVINKSCDNKKFNKLNYFILDNDDIIIDYKKMLKDITHIKFTKDQKKGIINIFKFLADDKEKIYGLYGYAGTGKTTTIIEIIIFLIKNKFINKIAFTAPTNKAVNVMKIKFKHYIKELHKLFCDRDIDDFDIMLNDLNHNGIVIDFITIHKLLKYEMDYDSEGNVIFVKTSNQTDIMKYEIIVIDECSMISEEIIKTIFTLIKKHNTKIIFCGDPAQLPPVSEKESKIFTKDINTITLKKVMRNKLKHVVDVWTIIRLWITDKIIPNLNNKVIKDDTINNIIGVYAYTLKINWFDKCLTYFEESKHDNIILVWTNAQANEYNRLVRETLFGKSIDKYVINDIIMLNEFYGTLNDKLYTSEQLRIIKVETIKKQIKKLGYSLSKNILKMEQGKQMNTKYIECIDNINFYLINDWKCWKMYVKKTTEQKILEEPPIIFVLFDEEIGRWNKLITMCQNLIKKMKIQMIMKNKVNATKIETIIIKPLWQIIHTTIINTVANISYGYAITCHKAQGSNYYNVYVDGHDILKNKNIEEAKKCLYTAVTRSSNELHLLL